MTASARVTAIFREPLATRKKRECNKFDGTFRTDLELCRWQRPNRSQIRLQLFEN